MSIIVSELEREYKREFSEAAKLEVQKVDWEGFDDGRK